MEAAAAEVGSKRLGSAASYAVAAMAAAAAAANSSKQQQAAAKAAASSSSRSLRSPLHFMQFFVNRFLFVRSAIVSHARDV